MSRQRPGVLQPYGAFRGLGDTRKRHRAGAIQDALALLCVLVFASLACTTHAVDWEPLPPLPEPNGGFVCGYQDGQIIVMGGTNWQDGKKNWLDKRHSFDPAKLKWSTDSEVRVKVAYAVSFQDEGGLAFRGGFDGVRARFGYSNHGVLAAGGKLAGQVIMVGGTDDPANAAGVSRETWTMGKVPRRMADYPDKPFAVAGYAVIGRELYVFGGMTYDAHTQLPRNTDAAFAFSPDKNVWRPLKQLSRYTRGLCAVALDDQHIYLAGGYTDDFTASAYIYDVKADSYEAAKPLPYAAMVSLVKLGGFVYCLGGEDKKQSRTDKCYRIPLEALRLP
jgi:N-acetylneuraminic acid mutarotase